MIAEYAIVTVAVAAAIAYVIRYTYRFWRGKVTGCGCGTTACPKVRTNIPNRHS